MTKAQEQEIDRLTSSLGRFASENTRYRAAARKNHEARRSLEASIRLHANGQCKCKSPRECLTVLARRIPKNPRPKYGTRKVTSKS
jgi:hypothetical protein